MVTHLQYKENHPIKGVKRNFPLVQCSNKQNCDLMVKIKKIVSSPNYSNFLNLLGNLVYFIFKVHLNWMIAITTK